MPVSCLRWSGLVSRGGGVKGEKFSLELKIFFNRDTCLSPTPYIKKFYMSGTFSTPNTPLSPLAHKPT